MVVRHCGFTAVVKVLADVNWVGRPVPQDIEIEDQPEGGANALNVNRSVDVFMPIFLVFYISFFVHNKPQITNCLIPIHLPIYISA